MHILIFINSKIPVRNYGGTQRVMWYLGKELSQMRHRVTFMAARGSRCEFADIIEYNPSLSIENQIPESVDVVHFNDIAPDFSFLKPYIVTYHGNRLPGEIDKNAVFATPYGSLQELVIPEVGFLTRSKREMIAHIRDYSGDYSPNICREYASDVFNSRKMACDYIKKYEIVMNGDVLNPTCPKPIEPFNRYKFV